MRFLSILLAVFLLAACAGTQTPESQPPAAVEDRGAKPAPATTPPVETKPIAGVDLTGRPAAGAAALKDPNNILSKRSVFYEFDRYDVKDQYKPLVEAHARYLRENGGTKMLIQGNTDDRGSREYNLALGQRRAESVKRMLMLLGGRDEQIEAVSLGEEKPRAAGASEEAYAQNRRSDMLYPGEY